MRLFTEGNRDRRPTEACTGIPGPPPVSSSSEVKSSVTVRRSGPEIRFTEGRKDMDRRNTLVVACAIVVLLVLLAFLEIRIQRMERGDASSARSCEAVSRRVERDRPTLTPEGRSTPSPIDVSSLRGHLR